MANFDLIKLALKATCPGNDVLLDDKGLPSVMVRIPKFKISNVITGGSNVTHPAFIVNNVEVPEIYISKFQNLIYNGRAYSLPGEDPTSGINFDTARAACEAKGPGWHLMTNAEWAALALWCRKNNLMPKGNNNYGKDTSESTVVAIPTYYDATNIYRVATGTGPVTWSHNGEVTGIWDLNGNVWEWVGGLRLLDGEIQIIPDNNAADNTVSHAVNSAAWKAILQSGALATPGTAGTLKYDSVNAGTTGVVGPAQLDDVINNSSNPGSGDDGQTYNTFETLAADAGITVPDILKHLALFPVDSSHGGDGLWTRNYGERLALRGGRWTSGPNAGVFALVLNGTRSHAGTDFGFRAAYIPGI